LLQAAEAAAHTGCQHKKRRAAASTKNFRLSEHLILKVYAINDASIGANWRAFCVVQTLEQREKTSLHVAGHVRTGLGGVEDSLAGTNELFSVRGGFVVDADLRGDAHFQQRIHVVELFFGELNGSGFVTVQMGVHLPCVRV
jgi:hypothetical protein